MGKTPVNEIKCTFLSKSENESLARSIISGFMLPLDPDVEELADIRCAVSEAVTNCIVHAYRGGSGMITLCAKYFDDRTLKITISDRGCGIEDVAKARTPLFTTCPDEDRCGMGFSIMESFSDKLFVTSKPGQGTKVTLIRKLSSPPEATYYRRRSVFMSECMEKTDSEDNLTLIAKAQSGDRAAMDQLISQNMGLVKNIARRFIGRNTEYEDLVQIGTIGMLKAAKSFDTSFGTVFSTYAVPLIIGEIRRFLRDDGIIKVSRDIRKKGTAIMKAKEEFIKEHQREPKISELSELCGMPAEDIVYALDAVCPVFSLQETVGGEEDGTTLENLTPASENEIESMTDKLALSEAIAKLDERSRQIVILRFYKDLSQQQTAEILGITQVKVSREEKKIFEFLRREL